MIWLIGNKGMLGTEMELVLKANFLSFFSSDKEIDVSDADSLRSFVKDRSVAWIINCSAYTAVDKAEDEADLAFKINAKGAENIATLAQEIGSKIIHISTDYVFDGLKNGAYFEEDQPNPVTVYGKSKLEGELKLKKRCQRSFIFRISWLFGLYGPNFVKTMLRLMSEKEQIRVVSDQWGSPTYTKDFVDLALKLIKKNSELYGIYHFSGEGKTNWFEFAQYVYNRAFEKKIITNKVSIHPIKTSDYPTKAKRPLDSYLSKEKTKKTFDFSVPFWQKSVDHFLDEFISEQK